MMISKCRLLKFLPSTQSVNINAIKFSSCYRTHSLTQVRGQTQGEKEVKILFRIKRQREKSVYKKEGM